MKISIIGTGLIGRKRALALDQKDILVACCDINKDLGEKFAQDFNCKFYPDYKSLLSQVECDAVIVAVTNKYIEAIVTECLGYNRHVISEKPLGRNLIESERMISLLEERRRITHKHILLKTGFNHRFHPAIWKAKEICDAGKIGKILNIRARYGHGGRPGMEKEWRASKDLCGGGELLDQGVHIIDLIRWFAGDFYEVFSKVETRFWNMEVEDNAFAIIKTANDITASMHVSWTNWKNIFSLEIFGADGYLRIEGLGGSYGKETLEFGIRNSKGGRPEVTVTEFPEEDISWKDEWNEFKKAIEENRECIGNGNDGFNANKIIEAMYESNRFNKPVLIK